MYFVFWAGIVKHENIIFFVTTILKSPFIKIIKMVMKLKYEITQIELM